MVCWLSWQALSSLCRWHLVCANQEPHPAVAENKVPAHCPTPVRTSTFSVLFNKAGPGRQKRKMTYCWLPRKTYWTEAHLTDVFVFLGIEESLNIPVSFYSLPYPSLPCCVNPYCLGKARVVEKGTGRACSVSPVLSFSMSRP